MLFAEFHRAPVSTFKDFLSSPFLGAPHAACGLQTTGYNVFSFKRQSLFSCEVGYLVTPIGGGTFPEPSWKQCLQALKVLEISILLTSSVLAQHAFRGLAPFCSSSSQLLHPFLLPHPKVCRMRSGLWRRSQTNFFQASSCARMPPDRQPHICVD